MATTYSSPYEKHVMTQGHPAKVEFRNVEPGEYIAQSGLGPFLATRWEELVICAFLLAVALYCSGVYTAIYMSCLAPVYTVFCFSWDVAAVSIPITACLGRKTRAKARKLAFATAAVLAAARWQYPQLYPAWYPFQPTL